MLRGYPIVVDELSADMGFRERITRQAIERALARKPDVFALADHDWTRVLGRQSAGTLRLVVVARGLRAEIDMPDTTAGRDVAESVRRGDTRGMSFSFSVPEGGDSWEVVGDQLVRTVTDLELYEVTTTARPAYPQTSIEAVRDETVREFNERTRGEGLPLELAELQHQMNGL